MKIEFKTNLDRYKSRLPSGTGFTVIPRIGEFVKIDKSDDDSIDRLIVVSVLHKMDSLGNQMVEVELYYSDI